jgi:hypothetical protein
MIDSTILNESQLARIYLVANTPSYLLRKFRADPSVFELSKRNTVDDLVSFAANIPNSDKRTLKDVVFAYAAIVALTFKNRQEVAEKGAHVSFEHLDWARRILDLGGNDQTGNAKFDVNIAPRIEQQSPQRSAINSVTISVELR